MMWIKDVFSVALAAAPWLLMGFVTAGVIKGIVAEHTLQRWVGGQGLLATSRAALMGMPLPLCSCGAIPTALALHRGGAGRGPTTAFLIGTPGVGVDSMAITYALLGPVMLVARVLAALLTAIVTGLLVAVGGGAVPAAPAASACGSCCGADETVYLEATAITEASLGKRLAGGIRYAFTDLLDDISTWLLVGLLLAGLLVTLVPPTSLAGVGSGWLAMLVMAVVGIPLYICATAATPVAAALLMTGVSPGTVLVFMLAGPITSIATLGVFRREMGSAALLWYMAGVIGMSVLMGWLLDRLVVYLEIDVSAQARAVTELLPHWLEVAALVILLALAIRPIRRLLGRVVR
ncbi:MAG: SO_0444 family Cu/Zn efflux transporter [Marinobacter sp.]|nr:SO_0444 family Cu/Zn efflux transporter [Marinobacter sp.]